MSILIKRGQLIDPHNKVDKVCDILVEKGKIKRIAKTISAKAQQVIDANGCVVLPGLVDMHVHLREPGREDKETIASATRAAIKGGVTSLLAMPNTTPCIDSPQAVSVLQKAISKTAKAHVFIAGAITRGRKGHEIVDIAGLKAKGVMVVTDDGSSVDDEKVLMQAMQQAKKHSMVVMCHCEDAALSDEGSVNRGLTSTRMGLRGISKESEFKRVERDIAIANKAGAHIHIAHVSCKESVEIIRKAKKKRIQVTAETCPHYFALSKTDVLDFDTNMKMNPPLRGTEDVAAIKKALADGTIDVVASDHAPHTDNEKDIEFERAAFGIIGLETGLGVTVTELLQTRLISWQRIAELLSANPAKILGLNKGSLAQGDDADIAIVDPHQDWALTKKEILSKSKNSPFINRRLKGRTVYTILAGKLVYSCREQA